jgi:heat shock protein HtpX
MRSPSSSNRACSLGSVLCFFRLMELSSPGSFPPARGLVAWASLALLGIIGAYVLKLSLPIICAVVPLWLFERFQAQELSYEGIQGLTKVWGVTVLCCLSAGGIGTAILVLWSLVPRRSPFRPPGPLLHFKGHPRLFAEIQSVAREFGIAVPEELYLAPDVIVNVAEVESVLGLGGRRVIVVGLPALQVLTVAQFRAMIANGFAHFYTGDTALYPWIHQVGMVMSRVLERISAQPGNPLLAFLSAYGRLFREGIVAILSAYWSMFLRMTRPAIMRLERRADELACHVAGTPAFSGGLRQMYRYGFLSHPFWQLEVAPIVDAGFLPPIAEGFGRFIKTPRADKASTEALYAEMNRIEMNAVDMRIPLQHRIAAAPMHVAAARAEDTDPAISLIGQIEQTDRQLIASVAPHINAGALRTVTWDSVAETVFIPAWRTFVQEHSELLAGMTPQSIPALLSGVSAQGSQFPDPAGMLFTPAQRVERFRAFLRFALSLTLWREGWQLSIGGGSVRLGKSGTVLDPAEIIADLETGKITEDSWLEQCRLLGIANAPLID